MMENFKEWLSAPYKDEMDAWHWFLFIGLLIAISVAWRLILKHLQLAE